MRMRHVEIDASNQALMGRVAQDSRLAEELNIRLELSFFFHDNALEGVVFSPEELRLAFDPSHVAERGQLPAYATLQRQKAALDHIRIDATTRRPSLELPVFETFHALLTTGEKEAEPPRFRKEIPPHRTYFHEIVAPGQIPAQLKAFAQLPETPEFQELPPVDQAATIHWQFMRIYPFVEQNGRIARLLALRHLLHEGYPLLVIHGNDRQRYFEALARPVPMFRTLMREAMEYSLSNALRFCGPATEAAAPAKKRKRA